MSFESNIINLNEWRYRAIVPTQPPRRKVSPVVKAAGGILIVASMGLGAYVAYEAVRFGALVDPVVLGTFGVLSAYLLTGAILFTGAYRRLLSTKSGAGDAAAGLMHQRATAGPRGSLVKFPEPGKEAEPRLAVRLRCRFCNSPFQVNGPRDKCPGCGRKAAAA